MPDTPKVCVDRILSIDRAFEAAKLAVTENPENVPAHKIHAGPGVNTPRPLELALITAKKWKNGRTIKVGFMDGPSSVRERVEELAHTWSEYANLTLDFGPESSAEIRISFEADPGSWSYLGTDALVIPRDEPTMNYGWLTPQSDADEYRRVVVHEFGHALGAIHEHQNPGATIPWDKEAVYRYYAGPPNNWSKEDVDHNLFERYSQTTTNFSDYDPKSIMHYPIPNVHTTGDFEVGFNDDLSKTDKTFMASMYPKARRDTNRLEVGGGKVDAEIGRHEEHDEFAFDVTEAGEYRVETYGDTDVVMSLSGPEDKTALRGTDDDSGVNHNARITATLAPGTYYVRVRHYRPRSKGKYAVSVSAA